MGAFLLTCLLVHKTLNVFNPTLVIGIAFMYQGLATWLIGPSYILRALLPNQLKVIISGLILTGLAGSFTSIGAYTEMNDPYVQLNPKCDKEKLSDILSGLYNAGFSLGTIVGPIAGSYLTIGYKSFGVCTDYFAVVTFIFSAAMLIFVYEPSQK
jgi:MFS family permease